MAGDRKRKSHADSGPNRYRKNACCVFVGAQCADRRRNEGAAREWRASSLHLAAQGAQQRYPAQSGHAARRAAPKIRVRGEVVSGNPRGSKNRRYASIGARENASKVTAHSDHHARISEHHAHEHSRTWNVSLSARSHRRRDTRDRGKQAWSTSRTDTRATGGVDFPGAAADRSLSYPETARRSRTLPRWL